MKFEYPKVKGGRVTDCNYDCGGAVKDIWIVLDPGCTSIEFESQFTVNYAGTIHLSTKEKAMD